MDYHSKEGDDSDSDYIKHSPDAMSRVARRPCTRVPNAAGGDQEDLEVPSTSKFNK